MELLSPLLVATRIIGWVLLDFLWQGLLLGLLYALGRTLLPRGVARYRLGMVMLLVLAICPVVTTARLLDSPAQVQSVFASVTSTAAPVHASVEHAWHVDDLLDAALPWVVLIWALCVSFLSLRAWQQWRRLKWLATAADALPAWQHQVTIMAQRFGLRRRVAVLRSRLISTPILVGWIRPVILLPVAVISKFPVEQIELILAHELAHLRRWDPVANVFQVVLETLFFYHPVVHWISRDVRNEREICCDELALSMSGGSRHAFGAALAQLGELRAYQGSLLVAATGGVLLDRVQHLVLPPGEGAPVSGRARFAAMFLGAILIAVVLRLELRQSQMQQDLDQSLSQLQLMTASEGLSSVGSAMPVLHLADLVLDRRPPRPRLPDITAQNDVGSNRLPLVQGPLPASAFAVGGLLRVADVVPVTDLLRTAPIRSSLSPQDSLPAPSPIKVRQPRYPVEALLHHTQGRVVMEFSVSSSGRVKDLAIVDAQPAGAFDQAARQAMQGWRFAVSGGGHGTHRYRQTMVFSLDGAGSDQRNSTGATSRGLCEIVTGSHICRSPDESAGNLRVMAAAQ